MGSGLGVRRALAALVVVVAFVSSASLAGGTRAGKPTLGELVGQRLVVSFVGTTPSRSLLARIRRGEIGGVILFGPNVESPAQVRRLTRTLHRTAQEAGRPRLLVTVDQEGGRTRRFLWAPPLPSAASIGTGSTIAARELGRRTGATLRLLGIDVDLAPVADVPRVSGSFIAEQSRAFSTSPKRAAAYASAFAAGLHDEGVLATAKHFPGLGGAVDNTDLAQARIATTPVTAAADLVSFRALVDGGVPLVMLSNASYPAYGGQPALLSPEIGALLRRTLGFSGVTITDAIDAVAATHHVAASTVAVGTARVGTDLLLFTGSETASARAYEALVEAARSGKLARASLERSYTRIIALKGA